MSLDRVCWKDLSAMTTVVPDRPAFSREVQ